MCAAPRLTPLRGTSLWLLSISLRFDSYIPMIKGHTYLIAIMDYLLTQVWGLASRLFGTSCLPVAYPRGALMGCVQHHGYGFLPASASSCGQGRRESS